MSETWRAIPGYEGIYEVSDQARVRSLDREVVHSTGTRQRLRGRMLNITTTSDGRRHAHLSVGGRLRKFPVDQLVAQAFARSSGNGEVEPAIETVDVPTVGGEIRLFGFEEHQVRVVVDSDGEPWWVAADVCAVLGIGDVSMAIARLNSDDTSTAGVVDSVGRRNPNTRIVNESGLWDLVLDSRKPEAKRFRRWVTSEVLPSIRRTGSYAYPSVRPEPRKMSSLEMLRTVIDSAIELEQKQAALNQRVDGVDERVAATELETWDNTVRLDAIEGRHGWYAAPGWAGLKGFRQTDGASLAALGHRAVRIGKAAGLQPGKVPHPRFTSQNTWPVWVWDQAAQELWGWTPPVP